MGETMKNSLKIMGAFLIMLLIWNSYTNVTKASTFREVYTVNSASGVILREAPSTGSTSLHHMTYGTSGTVFSVENGWARIQVDGITGYAPVSFLKKAVGNIKIASSKGGVIVRESASATSKNLATLQYKMIVEEFSAENGWSFVQYGNITGYVASNFIGKPTTYPATVASKSGVVVKNIASSSGASVGALTNGKNVLVHSELAGWAYVTSGDVKGYVVASFLSKGTAAPTTSNIVNPKQIITHQKMTTYLQQIAAKYPSFTELKQIGASVEKRPIYAIRIGNGKKEVLFDASVHAREHMTTNVLLEMIDTYSAHYAAGSSYQGYNVKSVLDKTAIWFVPMVNPDGVTLVQLGANAVANKSNVLAINGSSNFNRWKSNVRGVDLNDNFDSRWSKINNSRPGPSYMQYRGPRAFSEPEAQALGNFMTSRPFKTNISYHSSGQIMYWFNYQKTAELNRDKALANQLSQITGYKVMPPQYLPGSGASGDYFIQETGMPGIVLEISPYAGDNPVPLSRWDRIWTENSKIGLYIANEASKR